jgi:high affinity choline transporter 7
MKIATTHSFFPTLILFLILALLGLFLYFFSDATVFWPGYLAMMGFYGLFFFLGTYARKVRKRENSDDVLLAGRSLPLFLAIFTMSATWVGGGYINGTAEYTASDGLVWVQAPWGYALSLILGGLFFARKMRRAGYTTLLDPIRERFGRRMTTLLFLPALSGELFWTSAILTALGTTFGTVLGLDSSTAIILSSLVAIAYTSLGGLWAVAITDLVQILFLALGLILVLPSAFEAAGGWETLWPAYVEKTGAAATFLPSRANLGDYYWNWWDYALLLTFGGIPWQVYFQRVLAAKDENTAVRLSVLAGVICLLMAIPAVLIGIIGGAADWEGLGLSPPPDAASTLPWVMRYLSSPWLATLGLGAVAAAVMSSVDSSILSASTMASWNIYRPMVKRELSPDELESLLRKIIWIIGLTALLLALQVKSVYTLWYLCSDLVYCLLFPALVCALFDRKANARGAAAGFFIAFVLRIGGGEPTLGIPPFLPYPMIIEGEVLFPFRTFAMLIGLISIPLVSRMRK